MKAMTINSVALALSLMSSTVLAKTFAITEVTIAANGQQPAMENATVVVTDGMISAINPAQLKVDERVSGKGMILTPGLIAPLNALGLSEVGMVPETRDDRQKETGIGFAPYTAYNPKSALLGYARQGGITTSIVRPSGHDSVFQGQLFSVQLTGQFDNSVTHTNIGVLAAIGAMEDSSRASALKTLTSTLADGASANLDEADDETKVAYELVNGRLPLLVEVNRAADIIQVLKLTQSHPKLNLVLVGAVEAVKVKQQIAQAEVPVLMDPMSNLPTSFDTLSASLNNASRLMQAGVEVGYTGVSAHNLKRLRYLAGNSVANGVEHAQALKAVTATPAQIFGINAGEIAVGKRADLALWSADPFDYSSGLNGLWINGDKVSLESRQDQLRKRYQHKKNMPAAYSK
ncbi:amidohydrolase family protein [Paraferrimonas haliotis]|uniref:Amidohydrolase n=1 Tax=Paraferrimonas haliotis TaxID=2013866 RepID=A0AA37WX76_9GAMM|nr:amidohydrolase family protein [Paraferrimonas haliotis]GLS84062.1 amidohydrolase [Paraferrimonas haliotis]